MSYYIKFFAEDADMTASLADFFVEQGIQPELDFNTPRLLAMSVAEHEELAARWHERGLSCAVHLPFEMPDATGRLSLDRREALDSLLYGVEISRPYAPRHFVAHPYLFGNEAPGSGDLAEDLRMWTRVAEACAPAGLYLENTLEQTPDALARLAERLPANCGLCFDVGHWHAMADGVNKRDLEAWLDALGPFIRHLHLHDNHGRGDEHLAPGQGGIDWLHFANLVQARGLKPSVTFETCFDLRDVRDTRQYLADHPDFCRALGLL